MADEREQWIAARAYELWEQVGRPDGLDHEHWSQASYEWDARNERPVLGNASRDEEERML